MEDKTMPSGPTLGLATIKRLLGSLGNPQVRTPIVHVAGTNGKGSVCAMLDSMCGAASIRVGRFTSPHLIEPRDSITIRGEMVSRDVWERTQGSIGEASPFERLTATAFKIFAEAQPPLDLAIVEVGMGGRDDATNVVDDPLVAAITSIDFDHQAILGSTIQEIARAKAGIIKSGRPVVLGKQAHREVESVVEDVASEVGASAVIRAPQVIGGSRYEDETGFEADMALLGSHQLDNAAIAVTIARTLRSDPACLSRVPGLSRLTDDAIAKGLSTARWPGRLSWVTIGDRKVLVDGAHNPASAQLLGDFLATLPAEETTLIVALSRPRDPASILKPLLQHLDRTKVELIATPFSHPVEGMAWVTPVDPEDIVTAARSHCGLDRVSTAPDLATALRQAKPTSRIVVAGSLYHVADLYRLL